jgi:hypothetical protein
MQMKIIIDRFLRSDKSKEYKLMAFEKLVLLILASYIGNKSHCWPSYKSLAEDCSLSKSTLIRTIKSLENKMILKIERDKNMNNVYSFYPQILSTGSVTQTLGSVTGTPGVVSYRHPNNIINNIINKKAVATLVQPKEWVGLYQTSKEPSELLKNFINASQ